MNESSGTPSHVHPPSINSQLAVTNKGTLTKFELYMFCTLNWHVVAGVCNPHPQTKQHLHPHAVRSTHVTTGPHCCLSIVR